MDKERKLSLLEEIAKIKSINGNEKPVAEVFEKLFQEYDIETKMMDHGDDRASLVAEWSGDKDGKVLGLTGHFDVVDVNDEEDWSHDPFAAEVEDGKMYGRGIADMKAGLLALAIAMGELKDEDFSFDGTIRFLGTAGEEVGMLGSGELTEAGYTEDLDAMLVAEPVEPGEINTSHKGSINYEVTAKGKAAHSASPEKGVNAIDLLHTYMALVNEKMDQVYEDYENDFLGRSLHTFTIIDGGSQENAVPESARLIANCRTIPEFSNEKIIETIKETVAEVNDQLEEGELQVEVTQDSDPVESSTSSDLVKAVLEAASEDKEVASFQAVTDASNFTNVKNDFDMVIYGPGDLSLAHALDEHVVIEDYLNYIDEVKAAIKNFFK